MASAPKKLALSILLPSLDPFCRRLPYRAALSLFEEWTRGLEIALCLHRIGQSRRSSDPYPEQTIAPGTLDAFLDLVQSARAGGKGPRRLTLTFDDGYLDAVKYVASRAPRYPHIDWVVLVCPEKLVTRAGFRWDLWESDPRSRRRSLGLAELQTGISPMLENRRPELVGLGNLPEYRLATVEECRSLLANENTWLGNHTNTHLALAAVDASIARLEIEGSTRLFESLFGECLHFAFPFGVPERDFSRANVETLRKVAPRALLWSARQRPFRPCERFPGAVLPRVAAPGSWSEKTLAVWLALLGRRELSRTEPPISHAEASLGPRKATGLGSALHGTASRSRSNGHTR